MRLKRTQAALVDRKTSLRMACVRSKNTPQELAVRRMLHGMGLRFRIGNRDLPGTPDVANRSRQWVVFVHGCFWHVHAGCARSMVPKRNAEYWMRKFKANAERDKRVAAELRAMGYQVLVVWQCELQH